MARLSERELQRQQQTAKEEAFLAVRNFAEGLQDLAQAGAEQSEEIRMAGGIPPLVAMLGGGVMPAVEAASAMAHTNMKRLLATEHFLTKQTRLFIILESLKLFSWVALEWPIRPLERRTSP